MKTAEQIVQIMLESDTYSNWLGIRVVSVGIGKCIIEMIVREEMLNGHRIAHGGVSYALSDSALAFASNSRGQKCLSIETSIAHIAKVSLGDKLIAHCSEINCGRSIGRYETLVVNQTGQLVARFSGTVYRAEEVW